MRQLAGRSKSRGLFVLVGLLMELTRGENNQKRTEDDFCYQTFIAQPLYNRMFPSSNIWGEAIQMKPMLNSSCFYTVSDDTCTITSNAKGTSLIKVTRDQVYAANSNCKMCHLIPEKPRSLKIVIKKLIIQDTNIISIPQNAFKSWPDLEELRMFNNYYLKDIDPGAFIGLDNLWKLEIIDNSKLSHFHEKAFEGLTNLKGLFLQGNNISYLSNITKALSPKFLPNLLHLDLTGNKILDIREHDFLPMKGSVLYTLIIGLTKTNYIHPKALDPFGASLHSIGLSELNVNTTNLIQLINRTTLVNRNLKYISMEQNLFCGFPEDLLWVMSNVTVGLNLGKNHFGLLKPGIMPKMYKLMYLDLSEVLLDDIPDGIINSTTLPILKHLYLSNNKFTELTSTMVTSTLTRLVISKASLGPNALDQSAMDTNFHINKGVLRSMPELELLDLSGNNLMIVTKNTFEDATNLRVLFLQKTSLNYIEIGSFQKNKKLYFLDLSYNQFPIVIRQKNEVLGNIFIGLHNLMALNIAYCSIDTIDQTVFQHLLNLEYLSLQGNPIFKPAPKTFTNMPRLKVIDMRNNILTSWDSNLLTGKQCLRSWMLSYNNILSLTEAMLNDFKQVSSVDLYANSISCDCVLLNNVKNFGSDWNKSSFISKTKCSYPTNTSLEEYIIAYNLACVTYKKAIIACSCMGLAILLLILTVLYFKYKYEIQYRLLICKKKLGIVNNYRVRRNSANNGYFQYDAFVSYSAQDSSFVEKMRMILEKDGSKFRLCVFERDFTPGDNLIDKILECMEVSMVTILVLTESFAKSEWCRWEMSIAQNKSISQRFLKDSLIIILKSTVEESLMTPTLKYLMTTRVYLEWHEHSSVRQNIFWEKLKDALKERTQIKLPTPEVCDCTNHPEQLRKRNVLETEGL